MGSDLAPPPLTERQSHPSSALQAAAVAFGLPLAAGVASNALSRSREKVFGRLGHSPRNRPFTRVLNSDLSKNYLNRGGVFGVSYKLGVKSVKGFQR